MATPYTVNLAGGGQVVVNASSPQAALENAGNPQGASVSGGSYTGGGSSPSSGGGGGAPAAAPSSGSGALDQSLQKMLAALASGNAQQFQESKDEFNKNYELAVASVTGTYQGNPTAAMQQFNAQLAQTASQFAQSFGLQQAAVTGQYNGAPTEAAKEFQQGQAQQNSQFNANLGSTLLQAATQLRGPANYLQYQNLTHGGQSLLAQLYGNGQAGATAQPAGQLQSANLNNAIGDLGAGQALTGTGATIPQTGAGAGTQPDPTTAALLASFGLTPGGTLSPGQIDPARWDAIGSVGQDLTKNLASTYFGYDPTDFENQINATRPKGAAATNNSTSFAQPLGSF